MCGAEKDGWLCRELGGKQRRFAKLRGYVAQ
jgi:hypothetical protein